MMDLYFNTDLAASYKSASQKMRVMSEDWFIRNVYCPCCGTPRLTKMPNNAYACDALCDSCGENFELKTVKSNYSCTKIADGAFQTMIERITSFSNPNLFVVKQENCRVTDLVFVMKNFFQTRYIEKRKPLSENARRPGWVGCSIHFAEIPEQGKISIIENGQEQGKGDVLRRYQDMKVLGMKELDSRGWLLDVLQCVNKIGSEYFELGDMYRFTDNLRELHPENNNIQAKIRQQLQVLRDKGVIEFLERGKYRKIR